MTTQPGGSAAADRTAAMHEARRAKAEAAEKRTRRAIMALHARGEAVTFESVAEEADVSTSYLRKHEVFKPQIDGLRRTRNVPRPAPSTVPASTAASLRTKLDVVAERLRRVEAENALLRRENEALRGEVVDLRRKTRQR